MVPHPRLTLAFIRCGCGRWMGLRLWRGKDAHPELWCVSHGMCTRCYEALETACEAREQAEAA